MRIAYVGLAGRGATDALLAQVAERLRQRRIALAGTVQTNLSRTKTHPCDMDLQVLPDGPIYRISQDLGAGARGCRLNGGVLEEAVMQAGLYLNEASALIINKFGRLESEGRGFVPLIVRALDQGIPVLVGVNGLNLPSLLAFADGMADQLEPSAQGAVNWVTAQIAAKCVASA